MTDYDRWDDEAGDPRRARYRGDFRDDGPYRERAGMRSRSWAGDMGASGRYYDDVDPRAYAAPERGYDPPIGYGPRPHAASERGYDPPIGYGPRGDGPRSYGARGYDRDALFEAAARRRGGPYADYGRAYGGYGAGGGYTPHPEEGLARNRDWNVAAEGRHRGRGPRGYTRSDERIREDVNDRLTDDPIVDASDIEVLVSRGEVTLNGNVDSRTAKRRAEDCADDVSGVRHVQNNLRVRDAPKPGTFGAETDPRVAAVSEGKDPDRAGHDLAH